ncbi:MAG: putative colanic acid biosynthesis UDP-glucose lipid carrier transferase [Maribacter sp.]|jgi:putative colanic acid biosynthesis UDP-glucose lipid carrier transferase
MLHSKKLIRILIDLVGINMSYFIARFLVYGNVDLSEHSITMWIIIILLWFSSLSLANQLYGRFEYTTFKVEMKSVFNNYLLHFLGFTLIYYIIFEENWTFHLSFYVTLVLLLPLGRFLLKRYLPHMGRVEMLNYIVIGYCDVLKKVEGTISNAHLEKVNYLGSFGENIPEGYDRIGDVNGIYDFIKSNKVNMILYASDEMKVKEVRELMNYSLLNFIDFKIIPLEVELISRGVKMEVHNGYPIISVKDENIARLRNRFLKRSFDIVFSSFVIVFIMSWLYPLLNILIKIQSPGAALFNQKRVGYRNKGFICHKFRSMVINDEADTKQATKNDSRITKIGAFMRKTNLDEMPQFFNVLKGDMSVVGPRPHPVSLDKELGGEMEEYILRHYTKPGITGWAQVNGFRGPTTTEKSKKGRTSHDVWYLRHWSFLLDVKIVFLTVFGKKTQENAF